MLRQIDSPLAHVFSKFLAERSGFADDQQEIFKDIVQTLIIALNDGHICITVDREEKKILSNCRLISGSGDMPLVLYGSKLYLARYFSYEKRLAEKFRKLAAVSYQVADLNQLLDSCFDIGAGGDQWQRQAARVALTRGLCIVSGGPGTGKTTTVVKIAGLLLARYGTSLKIALAAPTGKAAMRLQESIGRQVMALPFQEAIKKAIPQNARTLHRLLGVKHFSPAFKYNKNHRLLYDVVIVDEASMVDLALMSKLVDALAEDARLILIGDKDQLASVESGAVLSDCMDIFTENVVELRTSWRFNEDISKLAEAINKGDAPAVTDMLEQASTPAITKGDAAWFAYAGEKYQKYLGLAGAVRCTEDLPGLFKIFKEFRILCALKNGPNGVSGVNERIEKFLAEKGLVYGGSEWYPGRPVIVTRNDYSLGLYNGDIGICLPDFSEVRGLVIWFEQGAGMFRSYLPARLPACETVWAMTAHKSQGSEFNEILVVLPEDDNKVLSRELLYTAVTRARERVVILADNMVLGAAVKRNIIRYSGLADQLRSIDNS